MAKVECYRPDGTMVMKEPVDARECVETCGFTMEAPKDNTVDPSDEVVSDCTGETVEEVKEEIVMPKVDGRKNRKNRNR
jgi:hypothetical protein